MNVFGQTHIGFVRENNQDALEYGTLNDTTQYAVVCDGMGGANGGNIASKIAVEVIGSRIRDAYREGTGQVSPEHLLTSAMATANIGVYDRAQREEMLSGMGTTVVAVITCGHTAYISHVGDSRLYQVLQQKLIQFSDGLDRILFLKQFNHSGSNNRIAECYIVMQPLLCRQRGA